MNPITKPGLESITFLYGIIAYYIMSEAYRGIND